MLYYSAMKWTKEDLQKIRARDAQIFKKIFIEYKETIYNFILIKTRGNTDMADEILCDTFHSALQSAPKLKNANNLSAWLLQIAHRRLIDILRKKYREDEYTKSNIPEDVIDDPEEELFNKEKIVLLKMALEELKPIYNKVLTLKYYKNMSQKEIAKEINKSISSVESLLVRARKALNKSIVSISKDFFNDEKQ